MMVEPRGLLWVLALLLLSLGLKGWALMWRRPKAIEAHFKRQGIGGPPYRLFLGNVKEMMSLMIKASSQPMSPSHNILPRVLSFYHHWKKAYGGTFLVWFGPTPRLTVADPDLIREIFASKSEFYEKDESHPLVRQLEGDGLLSLKGEKWALHRKIITPTFHMENLKVLLPVVGKSIIKMVENWGESSKTEIDVSESFQRLTEDIITRTAFGSSYEDGKAVFSLQSQQMELAADAFRKVFIPGYRFLPTTKNRRSWKLNKEIRRSLMRLIERREKEAEEGGVYGEDLLGLMIKARAEGAISAKDIVEECKTFFFAGKQTTSNLLTWAAVLLAMHPEWQDRARAEVLALPDPPYIIPSKDQLDKLKTMSMILNEALRLYPPAVATIRQAKTNVELGGYAIPKGMELLIPILAVHHDPALWGPDADEFNPSRFSDGVARAATHPVAFIPFGLGARTCIGQSLALLEAKLVLTIILRRFNISLSPAYRHAPTVLMLRYPHQGAPLYFRPLLSAPTS
ncbi:hypothetical protein AMTRI_Chr05g62200 [Amborella trichopoda]